jgi:GntR family transcriptional repressor for pyruvate dehydrogenase complex
MESLQKRNSRSQNGLNGHKTEARVFENIIDYFKDLIFKGDLKPGDHLMSERALATMLGVSRTSLREALRVLELLGLFSIVQGKGIYVLQPDAKSLQTFIELIISMQPTVSLSVSEARFMIECQAAQLACVRASAEEIAAIKTALKKMEDIPEGQALPEMVSKADFDFHKEIINATHNSFLMLLYDIIQLVLERSNFEKWQSALAKSQKARAIILQEHRDICDAIEMREGEKAKELISHHCKLLEDSWRDLLRSS